MKLFLPFLVGLLSMSSSIPPAQGMDRVADLMAQKVASGGTAPLPSGPWVLGNAETLWDDQVSRDNAALGFAATPTYATIGKIESNEQVYVIPIKLPYLNPGQTITGAQLSFSYVGKNGSPAHNIDVYGLARTSTSISPVPVPGDYYVGTNDTANSRLQQAIIGPSSAPGAVTCSNAALVSWLQAQYRAVGSGGYVFVRLNPDGTESSNNLYYDVANSQTPIRASIPVLTITTTGILNVDSGKLVFTFSLPSPAITSAGVFNSSTGALLRTLWGNVPYAAGLNYNSWDGNDDFGNPIAAGTYQIKVSYNNFAPVWQGVVGNTSSATSGNNVFRSTYPPTCLAADPTGGTGKMFYTVGYNENQPRCASFSLANPQVNLTLPLKNGVPQSPYMALDFVATDGINVYWANVGNEPYTGGNFPPAIPATFIFGTNMTGTNFTTFSAGTNLMPTGTNDAPSMLDYDTSRGSPSPNPCTGLAVQVSHSFLFVAHSNLNTIRVFNKTTGALSTTIRVPAPTILAIDPLDDLWAVSGTHVYKFTINPSSGAGTLATTISGLTGPIGMAVSPSGNTLLLADHGQIKIFSTSSGTQTGSFGAAGGQPTPAVSTSNFLFGVQTSGVINPTASIAYAPDGTFWILDAGNYRMLHYKISGTSITYLAQIAYLPTSYCVTVDPNATSHVFDRFLQYTINYAEPLDNGTDGSWVLTNNWSVGLNNAAFNSNQVLGLTSVVTLSNGHTYGVVDNYTNTTHDIVELTSTGLRETGITYPSHGSNPTVNIANDGSLRIIPTFGVYGQPFTPTQKPLTGFDGSGNPIWGRASNTLTVTPRTNDPIPNQQFSYPASRVFTTTNNICPLLDNGKISTGYHLGGEVAGGTSYKWRAALTLPQGSAYTGKFPPNGQWDIGNNVAYPGNVVMTYQNEIICGYHGESWKGNETGQFLVYSDDGLFLGRFGSLGTLRPSNAMTTLALAGFAGNAYSGTLVTVSGIPYLYVNDESNHGGIHRWALNNLSNTEVSSTGAVGSIINLH